MSLKIYFCGSIRAGRADADLYAKIIDTLKTYGTVLTEHVGNTVQLNKEAHLTEKEIHDRDVAWLQETDVVVAEVTQPSLGVGYEIAKAADLGKNILCLFRPDSGKKLSAMIEGAKNEDTFLVKHYEEKEYPAILKQFFADFSKQEMDS